MFDPNMELLSTVVIEGAARLAADPEDADAWKQIRTARTATGDADPELAEAVEQKDVGKLRAVADAWASGARHLPECDRAVLKRAMKAFRKSLKVTRLAADSKGGRAPLSSGIESNIVGIQPPPRYPRAVWEELARQGRLVRGRLGTYELPPGG